MCDVKKVVFIAAQNISGEGRYELSKKSCFKMLALFTATALYQGVMYAFFHLIYLEHAIYLQLLALKC